MNYELCFLSKNINKINPIIAKPTPERAVYSYPKPFSTGNTPTVAPIAFPRVKARGASNEPKTSPPFETSTIRIC